LVFKGYLNKISNKIFVLKTDFVEKNMGIKIYYHLSTSSKSKAEFQIDQGNSSHPSWGMTEIFILPQTFF
jgi:hypothetical protein